MSSPQRLSRLRARLLPRVGLYLPLLAGQIACLDPVDYVFAKSDTRLILHISSVFFENEPVYVVCEFHNESLDTVWTNFFDLATLHLTGQLKRSDGSRVPEWGLVVDYVYPPEWRGVAVAPGKSLYEVAKLQDRWGDQSPQTKDIYWGHYLPPGQYTFEAEFFWQRNASHLQCVRSPRIKFLIRPRIADEDSVFSEVARLAAMSGDTIQALSLPESLLAYVDRRASRDIHDAFLPYLTLDMVFQAKVSQTWPDSATLDRLELIQSRIAQAESNTPLGAYAVLGVNTNRPYHTATLAQTLGTSLAGKVAEYLAECSSAGNTSCLRALGLVRLAPS